MHTVINISTKNRTQQHLKLIMQDVARGLEDLAIKSSYEFAGEGFEILAIEPPQSEQDLLHCA